MNRKQQSVVLASLLVLALAGCESTRGSRDMGTGSMGSGSGGTSGTGSGTGSSSGGGGMASGGTAGSSSGGVAQTPSTAGGAQAPQAAPNAIVVAIDLVPSPSDAGGTSMGASGTAGTTGASPSAQHYRITLKMDDGTTRIVTSDKAPGFRNGDRVNMTDGLITQ
jgi:hypothetical protein